MTQKAKKFFNNGKRLLSKVDISEANRSFELSYGTEKSPRILAYLNYTRLLKSDYKALSKQTKEPQEGFGLYALYWFYFLSGSLDELEPLLQKMLSQDNYFLRVFAIKELHKKNRLPNLHKMIRKYVGFTGLNYELSMEEERASVYLDLLSQRKSLALIQVKRMMHDYPGFSEIYLDLIEILSSYTNKVLIQEILEDKVFLQQASKDFRLMFLLSREFYRAGNLQKAKDYLYTLIFQFKNNPLFYYNLGNIHAKEEKYAKAIDCYKESISLAPLFERAYYNLGTLFLKLGYVSDANDILEQVMRIEKKEDSVYNLSVSLIESKKLEDAYQHLNYLIFRKKKLYREAESIRSQIKEVLILR